MSELEPQARLERHQIIQAAFASSKAARERWAVDKLARRPVYAHQAAMVMTARELEGDERVVELGCNDGLNLAWLGRHGHQGPLVGIDISTQTLIGAGVIHGSLGDGLIDENLLVAGDIENIPLADDAADVTLAPFVVYYANDTEKALSELQRITRPGGKIMIATGGTQNKHRMHELESILLETIGASSGETYTRNFTAETAEVTLPQFFPRVRAKHLRSPLVLQPPEKSPRARERMETYLAGLTSYWVNHSLDPATGLDIAPETWERAVNKVVRPLIANEIAQHGVFRDYIHRAVFLCTNPD